MVVFTALSYYNSCNNLQNNFTTPLPFIALAEHLSKMEIFQKLFEKLILNGLTVGIGLPWIMQVRCASLLSPEWTRSVSSSISGGSSNEIYTNKNKAPISFCNKFDDKINHFTYIKLVAWYLLLLFAFQHRCEPRKCRFQPHDGPQLQ